MNDKIKQLAKQAKIQFTYDPTEKPIRAFAECWEDELEKFAELIVRECADIAMREDHDPAECIKRHFGVEA